MSPRRASSRFDDDDLYFPPAKPLRADGIRAAHQTGAFTKSWWADRWIAALERLVDSGRLARGRSYARKGQVLEINIEPGKVSARVQGSRPTPYKIAISVGQLTNQEWERVLTALAGQAIFAASLLNGEMPRDVETAFKAAGVSLFPETRHDLTTRCSCPDEANPCKHLAAVFYLLGERFDQDPFLIFRLRGRTREEVLSALRARRAGEAAPSAAIMTDKPADGQPLEELISSFWQAGADLDHFTVSIVAPEVGALLLKRLGAPPLGQEANEMNITLTRTYAAVTSQALDLAFGEEEEELPAS
jgi:uncharacterized Zn finger protein